MKHLFHLTLLLFQSISLASNSSPGKLKERLEKIVIPKIVSQTGGSKSPSAEAHANRLAQAFEASFKLFEPFFPQLEKLDPPLDAAFEKLDTPAKDGGVKIEDLLKDWTDADTKAILRKVPGTRKSMNTKDFLNRVFMQIESTKQSKESCSPEVYAKGIKKISEAEIPFTLKAGAWVEKNEENDTKFPIETMRHILLEERFKKNRSIFASYLIMAQIGKESSKNIDFFERIEREMAEAGWKRKEIPLRARALVDRFPECLSSIARVIQFIDLDRPHRSRLYGGRVFRKLKDYLLKNKDENPEDYLSEACDRMDQKKAEKYCKDQWEMPWTFKKQDGVLEMKSLGRDHKESEDDILIGTIDLN